MVLHPSIAEFHDVQLSHTHKNPYTEIFSLIMFHPTGLYSGNQITSR
jgi:hypothetical protein